MYISVFDDSGNRVMLYDNLNQVSKVEWTSKNDFVVLVCAPEDQKVCAVFQCFPNPEVTNRSLIAQGRTFDYDPSNKTLAILKDGKTVIVANQTYDLSDVKDGEIINIEWLPSLFYRD